MIYPVTKEAKQHMNKLDGTEPENKIVLAIMIVMLIAIVLMIIGHFETGSMLGGL
jgi:hypothetical protein